MVSFNSVLNTRHKRDMLLAVSNKKRSGINNPSSNGFRYSYFPYWTRYQKIQYYLFLLDHSMSELPTLPSKLKYFVSRSESVGFVF